MASVKRSKGAVSSVSSQSVRWWRANAGNVSFETLYGGQLTLLTQLINQNYLDCVDEAM